MKAFFGALLLFTFSAAASADNSSLPSLSSGDVFFVGEIHGHPDHHANQAEAVARIAPAALVFEMLTESQAARVPTPLPSAIELAEIVEWEGSGWPDFKLYYPIFQAAPDAMIVGAALPREAARDAMAQPITDSFGDEADRFGLTQDLPPDLQATREALQASAHCDALPEHLLPGMVAVQRLRDAMLARAALQAYKLTGGPVVVITGTGHARTDWGAPAKLAHAAPDLRSVSIGQFEIPPEEDAPFDIVVTTEPHPGPDPCDAFR